MKLYILTMWYRTKVLEFTLSIHCYKIIIIIIIIVIIIIIFTVVPCILILSKSFIYQLIHNRFALKEY